MCLDIKYMCIVRALYDASACICVYASLFMYGCICCVCMCLACVYMLSACTWICVCVYAGYVHTCVRLYM